MNKMKRYIYFVFILCIALVTSSAPIKMVASSSGAIIAYLKPHRGENVLSVVFSNAPPLCYTFKDIPFPTNTPWELMPITTDGLIWYDHSIAFFDERDEKSY